jgi:hypothetical protein
MMAAGMAGPMGMPQQVAMSQPMGAKQPGAPSSSGPGGQRAGGGGGGYDPGGGGGGGGGRGGMMQVGVPSMAMGVPPGFMGMPVPLPGGGMAMMAPGGGLFMGVPPHGMMMAPGAAAAAGAALSGGGAGGALAAAKAWKLFVGQISFDLSEEQLFPFFARFGTILELALPRTDGRSRGYAFLTYSSQAEAQACIEGADGAAVPGDPRARLLTVRWADNKGR